MLQLCAVRDALQLHLPHAALVLYVTLGMLGAVYMLWVLPRVYVSRRGTTGSGGAHDLGNIRGDELRRLGMPWAVWLRRLVVLLVLGYVGPLLILPEHCAALRP